MKITDLGSSKELIPGNKESFATVQPGATVYMPPEALMEGTVYDEKIDIYSYGILLCEIILRKHPSDLPRDMFIKQASELRPAFGRLVCIFIHLRIIISC